MQQFVNALADFRSKREEYPSQIECEIRLGQMDTSFCPGVSKEAFQQLDEDMTDEKLTCQTWAEHVDYHYLDAKGRQIRTRVTFDSTKMEINTEHVQKKIGRAHV